MKRIEFYTFNNEVWYRTDTEHNKLTEFSPLVEQFFEEMSSIYPKAVAALEKEYKSIDYNASYKRFRMVCRFVKCNFGEIDNVLDISSHNKWVFECVKCPLRGECKNEGVICHPEFNSELTNRENEVLRHVYEGLSIEEIAEKICLSPHTIKHHMWSAFTKLGLHSAKDYVVYASQNNIYGDERFK